MVQEQLCDNTDIVLYPRRPPEGHDAGGVIFVSQRTSEKPYKLAPMRDRDGYHKQLVWKDCDHGTDINLRVSHALPSGWGNGNPGHRSLRLSPEDETRANQVMDILQTIDGEPITEPQRYADESIRYGKRGYHRSFKASSHIDFDGNPFSAGKTDPMDIIFDVFFTFPTTRTTNFLLVMLLPAMYGGIHLAAFRYEFPTPIESKLWATSCSMLSVSWLSENYARPLHRFFKTWVLDTHWFFPPLFGGLGLLLLIYAACRVFIIMESFISIRALPVGVYWIPAWLQMFPHL
jgi:hypothetical protein